MTAPRVLINVFHMHSVLLPGIAGLRNVIDDDIAAHGGAIRDYFAGYWA